MNNIDEILKTLWDEIRQGREGEPNLIDVWIIAENLRLHFVDRIPTTLPKGDKGLKIVDYIDNSLFKDTESYPINHVMRNLSFVDFSKRMKTISKDLSIKYHLSGGLFKVLCIAFYTWFGCIFVAKLTRVAGSDGVQYTETMRTEEYNWIKDIWDEAISHGNPWIKYGASLSRLLEEKRKRNDPNKIIVDSWIPKDSPYWH